MQLNAITQKSALSAILLLIMVLVAATLRYYLNPYELELAESPYRERVISLVLAMVLVFATAFIEGKMLARSGLNKSYCTLPIPIYGVLSCGILMDPDMFQTSAAALCFALSLYLLLRSLHRAGEKDSPFFAAMLLGLSVLFTPSCVVLIGVIPVAILTLALSFRQSLLMVVGYLLPIFGASYALWYRGGGMLDFLSNIVSHLSSPHLDLEKVSNFPYVALLMVLLVVAILLWGGIYSIVRSDKMFALSRVRRSLHLFVWVLLLSLSMLLLPSCDNSLCAIVAVPATILLSFVMNLIPNNQSVISYWLLLLLFAVHLFVA